MAIQSLQFQPFQTGISHEVIFTGDQVRLAGQIDYPNLPVPAKGYPLVFILPDGCCRSRKGLMAQKRIGNEAGFAVFRWDKRGTGHSASGGAGHPDQDAINAYQTAVQQADIDPNRVIIWAQTDASMLLAEKFDLFKSIQKPLGIILSGNMLDDDKILKLDARILCVTGERDWNIASQFALHAIKIHEKHYKLGSSAYIAKFADRKLTDTRNNIFHAGAETTIHDWLMDLCPISMSI